MPTQDPKMHLLKDLHFSSQGGILEGVGLGISESPPCFRQIPSNSPLKTLPENQLVYKNAVPVQCPLYVNFSF